MNNLTIRTLSLISPKGTPLITDLSFDIKAGEVLSLMGPSGCGKSTLLSAIAGHDLFGFKVKGDVYLNEQLLNQVPVEKRGLGFLFQDDLLFPHLNIWQNLAFALPDTIKKQDRKTKAFDALKKHNLAHIAFNTVEQVSGGQRARISMIRMLLSQPKAVLLDEPFNKLDQKLRIEFRQWVFDLIKEQNLAALMVTHDKNDIPANSQLINWPLLTE